MSRLSRFVTLHPYFKIHDGKEEQAKATFADFAEKTASEKGNLFYEFTTNDDDAFCREGYENADALLAHLKNVEAPLAELLSRADLSRIEVHGPAAELEKLKSPLAHLNPTWFAIVETKN